MDVYTFLSENNLIKKEKDIKRKNMRKKIKKYTTKDNDDDDDEIIIQTESEILKEKKNKKILRYSNNDIQEHVNYLYKKYNDLLKEYEFIDDIKNLNCGGYIRYINLNDELRFGGILLKVIENDDIMENKLFVKNTMGNTWYINFKNNYIFFKKHKTKNDKFRNLFIKVALLDN